MSLMLKEIAEQPAALERTIKKERKRVRDFVAKLRNKDIRLIVIAARGSSDNASSFGRYLLEIEAGIPVSLAAPAIHSLYKAKPDMRNALVIGVSQSGEGVDINLTLENAKRCGATTLGITNEAQSTMAGIADETFFIHAGKEKSLAATKTYTGQQLMFHLLAEALSGRDHGIDRIPELAAKSLTLKPAVEEMIERYAFMHHCVVIGRGLNYGNAYEFAIKLMETCYVIAERFSGADFLHGPIAMIEGGFPVFVFAPPGPTLKGTRELLERLKGLNAETLVISSDSAALKYGTRSIRIPENAGELLSPIPYIIPAQLFAALLSSAKGINPDVSRSLSKVTRTV